MRSSRKYLDAWVAKHRAMIEAEKAGACQDQEEAERLGGAGQEVRNHQARQALARIASNTVGRLDNNVGFMFGIHIDHAKGTITIPATELRIADLTSANFATVIGELQDTADECIPLMRQRRMLEQSTDMSPEEIEKERKRIQELRRQEKQKRAKAEAGQPAEDFNKVEEPHLRSIDEGIGGEDADQDDDQDARDIDADEPEADVDADTDN